MMGRRMAVVVIAVALLMTGCGKAPQDEMSKAQALLAPENTGELEQYAPAAYQMARDTLNAALAAVKEQDGKFAVLRSYGNSRDMLVRAQGLADEAGRQAEAEKERIRIATEQLLANAQAAVDSAAALLQAAPKGKDTKAELLLIKNELDALTPALEQARADMAQEQYITAKAKTEAVIEKATTVATELRTAIARKSGK